MGRGLGWVTHRGPCQPLPCWDCSLLPGSHPQQSLQSCCQVPFPLLDPSSFAHPSEHLRLGRAPTFPLLTRDPAAGPPPPAVQPPRPLSRPTHPSHGKTSQCVKVMDATCPKLLFDASHAHTAVSAVSGLLAPGPKAEGYDEVSPKHGMLAPTSLPCGSGYQS